MDDAAALCDDKTHIRLTGERPATILLGE
jgi:hypothetical protein